MSFRSDAAVWLLRLCMISSGVPVATMSPPLRRLRPQVDDPVRALHSHPDYARSPAPCCPDPPGAAARRAVADIVEMQAGGGLVEHVERPAGLPLAQFLRQLDALRFAAGERGGGLPQVNVAEADIAQRLQLRLNLRNVRQERAPLRPSIPAGRRWSGLCTSPAGFVVVAAAAADIAGDVHVRQEIHLDALQPVALAGLAAAALHVEAEAARLCSRARAIPAAWRRDRGWR